MHTRFHALGLILSLPILVSLAWAPTAAAQTAPEHSAAGAFKIETNLRAGVAKVDITPPPETKVVGHVRETHGVRDPIRAAVLLLDDGRTKAALVTFDLLAPWDDLVAEVRSAVSRATGIPKENILVACSHNHSGPGWTKETPYGKRLIEQITTAAAEAVRGRRARPRSATARVRSTSGSTGGR